MWTLIAAGLNIDNFHVTEGAILHSLWPDPAEVSFYAVEFKLCRFHSNLF